MIIKRQKKIEFNSPHEVIFDKKELKKAILWYTTKPVARLKHVYLWGKYYAVSIYDEKIHIHRLLMMYWLQTDLQSNEYVHHINSNRFDNRRENLEVMLASIHQSKINKGRKQSPEFIKRRICASVEAKKNKRIHENKELLK